jgi:hypothetical protein
MLERAQRAAAVVQADAVRKAGPGKRLDLLNVVQELDELVTARANLLHLGGLLDRIEIVAHVMDAAAGWRDDVIEAREIAHEQGLGIGAVGIEPAVGHRLSATGLVAWVHDLVAETLEQLEGRNADLRKEGIDVAGNEEPDAHLSPPCPIGAGDPHPRSAIIRLVSEIARAGLSPFGQVLVQFMIV